MADRPPDTWSPTCWPLLVEKWGELVTRLLAPVVTNILGAIDLALGVVLLIEPRARVSSPGFDTAKMVMPMRSWGAIILIGGLAVLIQVARRHPPGAPLIAGASWHAFFTATLAVSAIRTTTVGLTGCVIYTGVVMLHLACAFWKHT